MRPPIAALLGGVVLAGGAAQARTLTAGAGKEFPTPSAAAAAADDGDTISIAPGTYFDCIATPRRGLTLEGEGDGVILTDRVCQDKAILVLAGDGATVRNLTLQRARAPDGNGAAIRLEAPNLTVQRVRFVNDQVGLLAGAGGGTIRIEDSQFDDCGVGGDRPLAAVIGPAAALLRITGSTFSGGSGGQITSAAERTELIGDRVSAAAGPTPIIIGAGRATIEDGVFVIGPAAPATAAAVLLLDDAAAALRRDRLDNRTGSRLALLLDWSWGRPTLEANVLAPGDGAVESRGVWRHRVGSWARSVRDGLRTWAGRLKRLVAGHL